MNKLTDKEMKTLLKNIVIIVDTREQENTHILDYFTKKKIKWDNIKLDQGDYSCKIESNPDTQDIIGNRDIYLDNLIVIERKNSLDELAGNMAKDRDRLENEMDRIKAKGIRLLFIVEDLNGYKNLREGNYRSEYNPVALHGSIKSFECRYNFTINYIPKIYIGGEIYAYMYYSAREYFKNGKL